MKKRKIGSLEVSAVGLGCMGTDPAGNVKPDKEKSTEKIDGAVAAIMALDRAIRGGGDTGASIYDGRGLLIL